MFLHDYGDIFSLQNKADKSASNSLNPSIFEGLVTLCAPDAVCFSRHIPHASGRILAERFCVIGTLRSNFLLLTQKKPGSLRIPDIYGENKHWKVNLRLQCNHFFQRLSVLSSEQKVSEYRLRILHEYLLR